MGEERGPLGASMTFQVLLYHGVLRHPREIRGKPLREYVALDELGRQIRWMKERDCTFLTLQDCRERAVRGDLPARAVCLTFDDGKRSDLDLVAPLLHEAGACGTFFIITQWLGRANILQPAELRRLSEMGMEIGSHSVSHPFMTTLSEEAMRSEAEDSKRYLEDLISRPVDSYSYPYGDVNARVRESVARAGYQVGCSGWRGSNTTDSDWLVLNRWGMHDTTGLQGLQRIMEEGTPSWLERGADLLKRSVGMRPYVRWRERFLRKAGG